MSSGLPLISVIVAVKNGKRALERCIRSFIDQTYERKEMVMIDGQSTDGSLEIIEKYRESLAFWVSEPDSGIYSAWNKGIRASKGDWIVFLGADDIFWRNDVLETIAPHLPVAESDDIRVVYGNVVHVDAEGRAINVGGEPWESAKRKFRIYMSIPHPGLLHHRALFERRGLFNESFRISGDYEFLLRELTEHDAKYVPGVVIAAVGKEGKSNDPALKALIEEERIRALRIHGLSVEPIYSWGHVRGEIASFLDRCFGRKVYQAARSVYWWWRRLVGRLR